MKWLFGLLVLANVGLFMWGTWYHEPLVGAEPPPPPDIAPEKMKLLSEPGARLTVHSPHRTAVSAAPAADARCYELGPFATADRARSARATLESWGLEHVLQPEYYTQAPTYRVYLPPFSSRQAAERRRRELDKLGFSDHALIQEAGMDNAISLGIFAVEANARARVAQLARKGVEAAIQPVPNLQPAYWLVLVSPATGEHIGEVPLTRFALQDWGASEVSLRPAVCRGSTPRS